MAFSPSHQLGGILRVTASIEREGGLKTLPGLRVFAFDECRKADKPEPRPQVLDPVDIAERLFTLTQAVRELLTRPGPAAVRGV